MTTPKYINRELSWLDFNQRVLEEAADPSVPLLERLRFAGIFSNNLDEFFKVRYATVKRIARAAYTSSEQSSMSAQQLLEEITQKVISIQQRSVGILSEVIRELQKENIFLVNEDEILPQHYDFVKKYFINSISPALFTVLLHHERDLPQLKEDGVYLAVKMCLCQRSSRKGAPAKQEVQYALIELPKNMSRFVVLPKVDDKHYIMFIDDIIRFSLPSIFGIFHYDAIEAHSIKITRDAELELDTDLGKSFIEKLTTSVEGRRGASPVRFVYDSQIQPTTLSFLLQKMEIDHTDSVIPAGRYHNRRDFMHFPALGRADLQYSKPPSLPIAGFSYEGSIIEQIAQRDYLQFTPFHSFSYIIRFLREAALDPSVRTIKITIYRLAKHSQVVSSLINAIKNGKQVVVNIELQARFDEQANIAAASLLQAEGARVIFGVRGLKVHSKMCVIERQEGNKLRRYGFVSTGNLNEDTAEYYTDFTLFTAHKKILKEVSKVFQFFDTPYKIYNYEHLIVSPHYTKKHLLKLIDDEIANAQSGLPAYIKIKINALTSYKIIDKLYEASQQGVKIQMIVRSACCLIPQVKGMSENIEVISIVDKYLEHARLYIFANAGEPKVFISSADFMTRNLDNRVEVTCPIYSDVIKQELMQVFEIAWSDSVKARLIRSEGRLNIPAKPPVVSQVALYHFYKQAFSER